MKMEALCNETTPAIKLYRCRKDAEHDLKMQLFCVVRNIFKREIRNQECRCMKQQHLKCLRKLLKLLSVCFVYKNKCVKSEENHHGIQCEDVQIHEQ